MLFRIYQGQDQEQKRNLEDSQVEIQEIGKQEARLITINPTLLFQAITEKKKKMKKKDQTTPEDQAKRASSQQRRR